MRLVRLLAGLGLLLGSLVVATPVAAGDPCYHGDPLPARSEGDEPQIKMMPCAFAPTVVRVAPGTTVEWFNDMETHLLTGANQEWGFRDDEIRPRETVAFRFDRPGTYPYACAIHRGMSGTIIVGDGVAAEAAPGAGPAVVQMKSGGSKPAPSEAAAVPIATVVPPPAADPASTSTQSPASEGSRGMMLAVAAVGFAAGLLGLMAFARMMRRPTIAPTRR